MYGNIPIAKIENWLNAPPPNVSINPNAFTSFQKSRASLFVKGTGINEPKRNTINTARVKNIFRLKSATRKKFANVRNIKSPQFDRLLFQLLLLPKQRIYEL